MNYTNELGLPQPFVEAVKSKHTYKPNRYSVTEVLGGTCEAVLKRRHQSEVTEDVSSMLWAVLGTAVHKVLESAQSAPEQHQEQWLCVSIDNDGERYELSGIPDLYDEATGTVTDWKVTSVWHIQFKDFESWRKQTLIYCWMLQQVGFEAWNGEIVAMLRDHSMRKAKTDRDYPSHPVVQMGWEFTNADTEQVEQEIRDWFSEVRQQEQVPDDELVPCPESARWYKPGKWAVMEKGRKRAIKLHDSEESAQQHTDRLLNETKGRKVYIEYRQGEDTKCQSYCPVAQFCPHGKTLQES